MAEPHWSGEAYADANSTMTDAPANQVVQPCPSKRTPVVSALIEVKQAQLIGDVETVDRAIPAEVMTTEDPTIMAEVTTSDRPVDAEVTTAEDPAVTAEVDVQDTKVDSDIDVSETTLSPDVLYDAEEHPE